MKTLFRGARFLRVPSRTYADWLLVEGGKISALGAGEDRPTADRTVDLDGGIVHPAFVDAHVHLPATGLYAAGLDLRGEKKTASILGRLAERAARSEGPLFGGNFEDPLDEPLDRNKLDHAVGARPALVARADMHSCVVSSTLLDGLDVSGLEGVDVDAEGRPTGYLREQAAAAAWSWFEGNLPRQEAIEAIRAAVRLAYSKGVASVHEMHIVEWRGWEAFDVLTEAVADMALWVVPYIAATDVQRVSDMGFHRIGGDYFLDGSFGSHTAWMKEPYTDPPPAGSPASGISYRDDDALFEFFREAQEADLQVGVHAIGDAAIEQAIGTWEKVAAEVGLAKVRSLGHRIEHFECGTDDLIARAADLRLRVSVQPAFDRFWGGEEGLYASRIGVDRALGMNRFASMLEAGLMVGAGSDSTVTPLDPFLQMVSLRSHHVEDEATGKIMALKLHTLGSRALAYGPGLDGSLEQGAVADLVHVDRDPLRCSDEELLATEVLGTWIAGRRVWPVAEAEVS
ncbi:MAG: amidohydrolase [Actinomycetota bacterium]